MRIGQTAGFCRLTVPTFYGSRPALGVRWSQPGQGFNRTVSQTVLGDGRAADLLAVQQTAFGWLELGLAKAGVLRYSEPKAWVGRIAFGVHDLTADLESLSRELGELSSIMPQENEFPDMVEPRLRITESLLRRVEDLIADYEKSHARQRWRSQQAIRRSFGSSLAFFREYLAELRRQSPYELFPWRNVRFQSYCEYHGRLTDMSCQLAELRQKMAKSEFYCR